MIIYGLLDSHILLSQASNLRIDSYVYTMEGLQEARKRLTNDGTMCLTFAMISEVLGRKLYLMMEQVFDGRPPICIRSGYDGGVIFIQHNDDQINIDPGLLETTGFTDVTSVYRNAPVLVDLPTDDWPFFYMAEWYAIIDQCAGWVIDCHARVPDCHIYRKAHGCCVVNLSGVLRWDYIFGPPEKTWGTI